MSENKCHAVFIYSTDIKSFPAGSQNIHDINAVDNNLLPNWGLGFEKNRHPTEDNPTEGPETDEDKQRVSHSE